MDYTCILFLIIYERKLEELIQDPLSGLSEIKGKKKKGDKKRIWSKSILAIWLKERELRWKEKKEHFHFLSTVFSRTSWKFWIFFNKKTSLPPHLQDINLVPTDSSIVQIYFIRFSLLFFTLARLIYLRQQFFSTTKSGNFLFPTQERVPKWTTIEE